MPMIVPQPLRRVALPLVPMPRATRVDSRLPIKFASMHGMGDNLHQRALMRKLMLQNVVYLDTPWPSVYHDLVGPRLVLVRPAAATLRTQAKNLRREAAQYQLERAPKQVRMVRTWYTPEDVRRAGSVLGAMAQAAQVQGELDFRLPVPVAWSQGLPVVHKPIMFYRPLVSRTEWGGCDSRNPEYDSYYALFNTIRDRFYVISIADLEPRKEWLVGHPIEADLEFHHGELTFELLAALARRASLVFCSPGFAVPLAQAVGTPVVCVFGGYENSSSFSAGAKFTATLGIDPMVPCSCFSHTHAHKKQIHMSSALHRLQDFVQEVEDAHAAYRRIGLAFARHRLAASQQAVYEPLRIGDVDRAGA